MFYKDAHAVVMVYDITNMESFQDINKYWLN
jgi:GTPase SAR1 family protein